MWKKKRAPEGGHVKFQKGTHRPYVTPYDLVTSENFQKEVARAMKKTEHLLDKTKKDKP